MALDQDVEVGVYAVSCTEYHDIWYVCVCILYDGPVADETTTTLRNADSSSSSLFDALTEN